MPDPTSDTSDTAADAVVPASIGASLRAAREAAGRSIEQVSEHTRIRTTLIRDLEADRFGSCGGAVYARGHLRAIAVAVGVDAAPFVARFDEQAGRPETLPPVVEPVQKPAARGPAYTGSILGAQAVTSTERRGPRWGVAIAAALGVLVAVIIVGFNGPPSRHPVDGLAGAGVPSPTSAPKTAAGPIAPAPKVDPGLTAKLPPATGAQLRVRVIGAQSWVSVRNATATLFEGVLRDGDFKDFTDPTGLRVVVGNASAVNLNCGGKDSGPAGSQGAVRRFSCTAGGLTPA